MKLLCQEKIIASDVQSVEQVEILTKSLQEIISKSNMAFSHFRIDGVNSYQSLEEIVNQYGNTDSVIEIVTETKQEYKNELLQNGVQYLKRAIPALDELAQKAYQGEESFVWENINDLTEGTEYLLNVIKCSLTKEEQEELTFNLNAKLEVLLEAVENGDLTYIGDIVLYEILPLFKKVYEELKLELEEIE